MRISVAIAAYNGDRFIEAQLRSIVAQSRPPAEIVVVDDASTDGTRAVLEAFAAGSPVPVRLLFADANGGSTAAFERAIAACSGDWIALADQDDAWRPDKLEVLAAVATAHACDAVFSDATIADARLQPTGGTLLANSRLTPRMRASFHSGDGLTPLLRYNVVTGATLMFKAAWRPLVLPIDRRWVHDYWIALLIAGVGRVGLCDAPLILYRQHGGNQIGANAGAIRELENARTKTPAAYLAEADALAALRTRLESAGAAGAGAAAALREKEAFLRRRHATHSGVERRACLKNLLADVRRGSHFKYARGWRALFKDLAATARL